MDPVVDVDVTADLFKIIDSFRRRMNWFFSTAPWLLQSCRPVVGRCQSNFLRGQTYAERVIRYARPSF